MRPEDTAMAGGSEEYESEPHIDLFVDPDKGMRLFKLVGVDGFGVEIGGKVCIKPLAEWHRLGWEESAAPEAARTAWISVSEKMPARHQDCIVAFDYDGKPTTVHGLLKWDGEAWRIGVTDIQYPGVVTHWQPLPSSPQSGEQSKEQP